MSASKQQHLKMSNNVCDKPSVVRGARTAHSLFAYHSDTYTQGGGQDLYATVPQALKTEKGTGARGGVGRSLVLSHIPARKTLTQKL